MSDTVIVAIVGAVASGICSLLGVLASSKLTTYRIEQLEKKVDAHNQVIERVYNLEQVSAVRDEEVKVVNHRLEDLEKKVG